MPYDENALHDENVGSDEDREDQDREEEDIARSIEFLEAVERESRRLLRQADRLVRALAAKANLDPAAFRCLHLLHRQGPLSMRRLSALSGLGPDTALAAVAALESAGLVRRCRDAEGREVMRADQAACRARVGPALRELREAWYPLSSGHRDDLALIAALLADGRRLSELVLTLG